MMRPAQQSRFVMKAQTMSPRTHSLAMAPARPALRLLTMLLNALHLRQTRQRLGALEPHLLRDIGLTADQAQREAIRPLWDAPKTWSQRD